MTGLFKVFFKGALGVCATVALVAAVWTLYLQRDALASALAPATGLVNSLKGVAQAPDSEPASAPPVEPTPRPDAASADPQSPASPMTSAPSPER